MTILILGPCRPPSLIFARDLKKKAALKETSTTAIEEIEERKEHNDSSNTSRRQWINSTVARLT